MTFTHLLLRRVFGNGGIASLASSSARNKSIIAAASSSSSSGYHAATAAAAFIASSTAYHHHHQQQQQQTFTREKEEKGDDDAMARIFMMNKQITVCEAAAAAAGAEKTPPKSLLPSLPKLRFRGGGTADGGNNDVILRKRMTSIGRFSMKSETIANPSIPTFFLALANTQDKKDGNTNNNNNNNNGGGLTVPELESIWINQNMHNRHPRFHSRVSKDDDRYFEQPHHPPPENDNNNKNKEEKSMEDQEKEKALEVKAEVHNHAIETLHPSIVYRDELRKRIEHFLTKPLDVMDKLWEVELSTGPLGSSGAIGRAKVDQIRREQQQKDARNKNKTKEETTESILLFRAHHALADGVSLAASLADLSDEAEELRQEIENEINRRKKKFREIYKEMTLLQRWMKMLRNIIWFCLGSIKAILYQMYVTLATIRGEPFENVRKMYQEEEAEAKRRNKRTEKVIGRRSISWCDAASLEEVKFVAKSIGKNITLNDVFLSCASSAIARQLAEHRQLFTTRAKYKDGPLTHKHHSAVNVVIPVHLGGGVLLPGKSVGNYIGAMVARIPGEINNEDDDDTTDSSVSTAVQRLKSVHASIQGVKNTPAPLISYLAAKLCSDLLPESLATRIFQNANANAAFVLSNTRGPPKKLHIGGRPAESVTGFFPLPPGIPVGVVVGSYAGVVSISVTAEKWAIPDADKFLGWMLEEYRRLYDEALMMEEKDKAKKSKKDA